MTSKVAHVTRLIHDRDALIAERERLVGNLDRQIQAIDEEIEEAWQGASAGTNGHHVDDSDEEEAAETEGGTNLDRLVGMIRREPGEQDYGVLARAIYGSSDANAKKRIRVSLSYLAKQGRLRSPATRTWEVVDD